MKQGMQVELDKVSFGRIGRNGEPVEVFEGLDLTIRSGWVHSVVGRTGVGKTTLLRLIAGLDTPRSGSIKFTGEQNHPHRTAMVFQDPTLIPWWTTGRNIGTGVEFDPKHRSLYRKIRAFSADRVGLGKVLDRLPGTLSQGMQTRAGLARAFAYDADVMLLDEPFVHLDALTKRRLWEELETSWQLDPRTYVLVTHDIEEAVLLSDRVSVLAGVPARVAETLDLGIPRPRSTELTTTAGFRSAIASVWDALERAASS
jgi:NitT/TauT family transport system ATP-binding protein